MGVLQKNCRTTAKKALAYRGKSDQDTGNDSLALGLGVVLYLPIDIDIDINAGELFVCPLSCRFESK